MSPGRGAVAAALLAVCLAGCGVGYVARAGYEEARILWRREPIAAVLARPDLDPDLRAQLELVGAVRAFASERLGLRVGGQYDSLAAVDADQVVHVVTAAPRTRLEPITWWFPIVGRVPYRGYFDRADAEAFAAALEREGNDAMVRPAVAFSTLGWFDDPLLSTMLDDDPTRLAETVIHELVHATRYVPGQAAFNESLATFVGLCGAERFFAERGDDGRAARLAARWADAQTFSTALAAVIVRLRQAYAGDIDEPQRQALFAALQADVAAQQWLTPEYAAFWRRPIDNAVIVHDRLYADRLSLFDAALGCAGDDLPATVAAILARLDDHHDPWGAVTALGRCVRRVSAAHSRGYGSIASRWRRPLRTETTRTAAMSATTAANEATIEAQAMGDSAAPRKRAEKMAYTGHASSTTTTPMNDMHSTM
jgi:predicted aminopeptidase